MFSRVSVFLALTMGSFLLCACAGRPLPANNQRAPTVRNESKEKENNDFDLPNLTSRQSSAFVVSVTAGDSPSAVAYGIDVHTITDEERSTFNIDDYSLKQAVEAYKGRSPNDAFVRGPTPWDDLYSRYGWSQVTANLVPISAEVLEISNEPILVKSQTFENPSSQTASFNVFVTDTVTNSATSSWTASGSISATQSIKYNLEFLGTGGGGETSFGFELGWGLGGSQTQSVAVGSRTGVDVELEPGEAVVATLKASRGTMKVKVTYRTTLSGHVACNYNPPHEGHHFWAYDVNGVLDAGGLSRENYATEILDVGYYSDASVVLSDLHAS